MLFKMIRADAMKLRRSPVWLAFIFMPIIPALLGTINYTANLGLLKSGWYSLWTQHTIFTCYFFLPIMLGIYCSYLMRLEHSNHNWNKLLTMPVPIWQIFVSKLVSASLMVVLSEVWIGALFYSSGKIVGLAGPLPSELIFWLLCGTLGGIVMTALQLFISLVFKSFALPVGIALAGGLSGLVALAKGFGHIYPYSLMAYGMRANAPQTLPENGYLPFAIVCAVYIVLFVLLGALWLTKRDAK